MEEQKRLAQISLWKQRPWKGLTSRERIKADLAVGTTQKFLLTDKAYLMVLELFAQERDQTVWNISELLGRRFQEFSESP